MYAAVPYYVAAPITKKKKKNALWTVSSGSLCHVPSGSAPRVSNDNRVHSRARIDLLGVLAGVSKCGFHVIECRDLRLAVASRFGRLLAKPFSLPPSPAM